MSAERQSVDDLSALARRGRLSGAEQERLQEQLKAAFETRLLFEAGRLFDREALVATGDEKRIERIARRVQPSSGVMGRARQFRQIAQAMAVGTLLAGMAIGASDLWQAHRAPTQAGPAQAPRAALVDHAQVVGSAHTELRSPPPASSALSGPAGARMPFAPSARPQLDHPEASSAARAFGSEPSELSSLASPVPSAAVPVAGFAEVAPEAPRANAVQLFSSANRARVNGDLATALSLYQRLCRDFPSSSEALTAHLSLGMAYLQHSNPEAALEQFRICREAAANASRVDALWGEAQALRALSRSRDERATLERIVREYPASADSNAARKRLLDLP